jgi:hypothetical protein
LTKPAHIAAATGGIRGDAPDYVSIATTDFQRIEMADQRVLIVPRDSSGNLVVLLSDYPNSGGLGDESPNVAPVPELHTD